MDNQERVRFEAGIKHLSTNPGASHFEYDKLFTLSEFVERYGQDNCTIMLKDQERVLYGQKVCALDNVMKGDPDRDRNIQVALDAWKPCDDRPPTEIEAMVQKLLGMPDQAQAQLYRLVGEAVKRQDQEQARIDAEKANEKAQAIQDKFNPPADVGPPVTTPQQEPAEVASFEQIGADADQAAQDAAAVESAQAAHAADIEANAADYTAPSAFEEGGNEGAIAEEPAQTEVGMPPRPITGQPATE